MKSKLSYTNTWFLSWRTIGLLLLSQHFKSVGEQQGCKTKAFQKKLPVKKGLFQIPQIRSTSEQKRISSTMPQLHGLMKKPPKTSFNPGLVYLTVVWFILSHLSVWGKQMMMHSSSHNFTASSSGSTFWDWDCTGWCTFLSYTFPLDGGKVVREKNQTWQAAELHSETGMAKPESNEEKSW